MTADGTPPDLIPLSEGQTPQDAMAVPEPFFALKLGPWSCFCMREGSHQFAGEPNQVIVAESYTPALETVMPGLPPLPLPPRRPSQEAAKGKFGRPAAMRGLLSPGVPPPDTDGEAGEGGGAAPTPPDKQHGTMICGSLRWLNALFAKLWPSVSKAIEKIAREEVEPILRSQLPKGLKHVSFKTFSLGTTPPNLGPMMVCDTTLGQGTELRLGVHLDSDVDIELDFRVATVGIRSLVFSGEIVCRLEPLLNEVPVVGGVVFYFLDPPKLDLQFTGVASIASYPGVITRIRKIIETVISEFAVLPNVVAIPLGTEEQGVDRKKLHVPAPRALLRVTAVKASDLIAADISFFGRATSDPYVRIRMSDADWRSSTAKKTLNPVWKRGDVAHDFLVFDPEQRMNIEVYDEDVYSQDDLIGKAPLYQVADAVEAAKHPIRLYAADADLDSDEPTAGTLELSMEYLEICYDGVDPTKHDVCLLEVSVDSVFVPSSLASSAALAVEVCKMQKKTPVKQHASPDQTSTAVDAALNDVVERCQAKAMDPDLVRSIMGMKSKRRMSFRRPTTGWGFFRSGTSSSATGSGLLTRSASRLPEQKDYTILTIEVEHALYFIIPTSALKTEKVHLMLLDGNMCVYGEILIDLRDVLAAPRYTLPKTDGARTKITGDQGLEVELEVTLRLRGFAAGVPHRPHRSAPPVIVEDSPAGSAGKRDVRRGSRSKQDTLASGGANSLQWLNELAFRMWPQVSRAIKKIVYQEVTPLIQEQMPGPLKKAKFSKLNLGDFPPELGPLHVLDTSRGLELRLGVHFSADVFIELDMVVTKLGIKAMKFQSEVIIRLEPLIGEVPVVGGLVIYFLDPPKLDLEFTGAASIANYPGVPGTLRSLANTIIGKFIILPNVVAIPLGTEKQGVDRKALHKPEVIGVLRATALSATDLPAGDWSLLGPGTSDPYVRMRLSDEDWSSDYVSRTLNPVWTQGNVQHNFLVFDRDQGIAIDVYDHDFASSDDHLGRAAPMTVREALASSKQPFQLFDEETDFSANMPREPKGSLTMDFEWLDVVQLQGGRLTPDGCLLEIRVDEIRMPATLGNKAGMLVKLSNGVEKHTPVKVAANMDDACDAVTNAINDFVSNCQAKALDPSTIASITGVDVSKALKALPPGDARKPSKDTAEAAKALTTVTVSIEDVLFIILPEHSVEAEDVEVAIINDRMRPMASMKVNLLDLVHRPVSKYPVNGGPVTLTSPDNVSIEADLVLQVRGLMLSRAIRRS